jgi:hypothetical protein
MSDFALLMCQRVGEPGYLLPGSMQKLCADCGAGVWVSLASLVEVTSLGLPVKIACLQCAQPHLAKGWKLQPLSEGQLMEVSAALHRKADS